MMHFKRWISVGLLCLSLMACSRGSDAFHDASGRTIPVSQFQGKWVIVNYWAAWCEGCVKEIPELNHFYAHHHNDHVLLFGVNYDHTPMPDLTAWVNKERITYPVLVEDPKTYFNLTDVDVLPMTFIIDPKGHVVKSIAGPNTEKSLWDALNTLQKKNEPSV